MWVFVYQRYEIYIFSLPRKKGFANLIQELASDETISLAFQKKMFLVFDNIRTERAVTIFLIDFLMPTFFYHKYVI